jgi:hypothetical protein
MVSPWFPAARRYAVALGFGLDNLIFARAGGACCDLPPSTPTGEGE